MTASAKLPPCWHHAPPPLRASPSPVSSLARSLQNAISCQLPVAALQPCQAVHLVHVHVFDRTSGVAFQYATQSGYVPLCLDAQSCGPLHMCPW